MKAGCPDVWDWIKPEWGCCLVLSPVLSSHKAERTSPLLACILLAKPCGSGSVEAA